MENKFIAEQKSLLSILASMQPICTKRTTIDATASILFQITHNELVLKSTDMEISLQASHLLKESDIGESCSFLVSGRRIFELVKELEGDIVFSLSHNQLLMSSGAVRLSLNTKDAQEFPSFPECIENLMQLEAQFLLEMLNKVGFLIPQNNSNPALNGLLLEILTDEIRMTSTDGHCLVQAKSTKYHLDDVKKWLLPRRAVFELKKLLESTANNSFVFLGVCRNQLVFSGESFNFFTKLLADTFPHYSPILDKTSFAPATVDRTQFIKTLRRSSCLLSGQFIATKFDFTPQALEVSIENKEVGNLREHIPLASFEGEEMDIRFYAPYLLSGLQVFNDEQVVFYLKNKTKPIIFESNSEHCHLLYLVMPVAPTHG